MNANKLRIPLDILMTQNEEKQLQQREFPSKKKV